MKNPNEPITHKEFQNLQDENLQLRKLYNELLRKFNNLNQELINKERKLKQQIRNIESKIPRR
ncbi:MAG: hypothetical protein ACOC3V_05770 [bacterium]